MIVIPGERIKNITAQGLTYVGDDGAEAFIDFALCRQNLIEQRTIPETLKLNKERNGMTEERFREYIARIQKSKEVGFRNIVGSPDSKQPYIIFTTKPPIRFEFLNGNALYVVQNAVRKAGWRTMDLS